MTNVIAPEAEEYGLVFESNLSSYPFIIQKVRLLPYSYVREKRILPLQEVDGKIRIAIENLSSLELHQELCTLLGRSIEECLTSPAALDQAIEICYRIGNEEIAPQKEEDLPAESLDDDDLLGESDSELVRFLNVIFTEALDQKASDIHIDPQENAAVIRYRIDGVLVEAHHLSRQTLHPLITRIKVLSKLDIAEQRLPQDGRMKLRLGTKAIDCRVSSIPVLYGERIVLRILDRENIIVGLDKLFMPPALLANFRRTIHYGQGIILVTGPTGSGKTTTLYSALSELSSPDVNIMTIEDPVEYKLEGLAQMSANPKIGLTFAAGLRHLLRQDPDIIMVGEIRDKETADIAIQASLTGHLVLSTLHTNDAPSAITRLIDIGIEPFLVNSSLMGVMAQRLIRAICPHCKEPCTPTELEQQQYALLTSEAPLKLIYRGRGCPLCYQSGFKGRVGVYEWMPMTHALKQQLLHKPDAAAFRTLAIQEGMQSLTSEAARLIREGTTTPKEALRSVSTQEK